MTSTLRTRCAIIAAVFVLSWAALGARARTAPHPTRLPLLGLPMQIGTWHGRPMPPLDPRVLAVLGADDHLMRLYQDPGGRPLSLYVGFHAAQQRGDSIHSPMNCLPGAGWQPITSERLEIADHRKAPASADRTVTVNGVTIEKGDTRQLVLYWYLSQGRVIASEYRAKGYLFLDALRTGRTDAALIRIVTPLDRSPGDIDRARATATAFAGDLLPVLAPFIPE